MRKRASMPPQLRDAYSRLHKTINQGQFIKGSVVVLRNRCGKKNCKCAGGELHTSLYLSRSSGGKQKMMLIPAALQGEVRDMTARYGEIKKRIDAVSALEWKRIEEVKKKK